MNFPSSSLSLSRDSGSQHSEISYIHADTQFESSDQDQSVHIFHRDLPVNINLESETNDLDQMTLIA